MILVGLSATSALAVKYQPTPTLSRACQANPVKEMERGNGLLGLPYRVSTTTPSASQPKTAPAMNTAGNEAMRYRRTRMSRIHPSKL